MVNTGPGARIELPGQASDTAYSGGITEPTLTPDLIRRVFAVAAADKRPISRVLGAVLGRPSCFVPT